MPRILTLGLLFLSVLSPSFGQQSDRRIEDAVAEITLLKRVVAEQDRRIATLEKALDTSRLGAVANPESSAVSGRVAVTQATTSTPWRTRSVWSGIKEGMSRAQVVAILGQPTSVNVVSILQTLFYRGEVSGSASVTGTVELMDDRVWQVNVPVF
jgi:hypothetical protein